MPFDLTNPAIAALFGALAGASIAATTAILTTLHNNREGRRRLKMELASRERQHARELRARFMDHLMKPRTEGHVKVLTQLWHYRYFAEALLVSRSDESRKEFLRAKSDFAIEVANNRQWLRLSALNAVNSLTDSIQAAVGSGQMDKLMSLFGATTVVIENSMGIEHFNRHMEDVLSGKLEERMGIDGNWKPPSEI